MTPIPTPLTGAASLLKPLVYKSGKAYSCELLSVIGKGAKPEAAVQDWNDILKEHLSNANDDDEVVKHVRDHLKPNMDEDVRSLHDKFELRPVDRSKTKY